VVLLAELAGSVIAQVLIWLAWGKFTAGATKISQLVNGKVGKGDAATKRAELEKPPISKDDGRRKRATGRTAVFNTKLKPEFRAKLFALAEAEEVAVAAMLIARARGIFVARPHRLKRLLLANECENAASRMTWGGGQTRGISGCCAHRRMSGY
jgi:hypothetical protein